METAPALLLNTVSNPRRLHRHSRSMSLLSPLNYRIRFTTTITMRPLLLLPTVDPLTLTMLLRNLAEFRGPGVHHNFDDSDSGYDVDSDNNGGKGGKSFTIGGHKGRIIFLGDGTEILTDSDDAEMFDNSEEDKDLASQVSKGSATEEAAEGDAAGSTTESSTGSDSDSKSSQPDNATAEGSGSSESKPDETKGSGDASKEK